MKDAIDSMPTERPLEQEGFANRKLIRPSLEDVFLKIVEPPLAKRARNG